MFLFLFFLLICIVGGNRRRTQAHTFTLYTQETPRCNEDRHSSLPNSYERTLRKEEKS
jgi:hypothetical protein